MISSGHEFQNGFLWTFPCPLSQMSLFRWVTLDAWLGSVQFAGFYRGVFLDATLLQLGSFAASIWMRCARLFFSMSLSLWGSTIPFLLIGNGASLEVTVHLGDQANFSLMASVRRSISFQGNGRCHLASNCSAENLPCKLLSARQNGTQISSYDPVISNSRSPLP